MFVARGQLSCSCGFMASQLCCIALCAQRQRLSILGPEHRSTEPQAGGYGPNLKFSSLLLQFTPICPHSLSFRPVILPDYADVELKVPTDAR